MIHDDFTFKEGKYQIQVYVKVVGKRLSLIYNQPLTISKQDAKQMKAKDAGIYFHWIPGNEMYNTLVDKAVREL